MARPMYSAFKLEFARCNAKPLASLGGARWRLYVFAIKRQIGFRAHNRLIARPIRIRLPPFYMFV